MKGSKKAVVPPPHTDTTQNNGFMDTSGGLVCNPAECLVLSRDDVTDPQQDFGNMDFANPLTSSDVLNDFDFDSFLHDGTGGDDGTFDFGNSAFGMEGGEIGAE